MKVILLLDEEAPALRPHTWSRPKPLLQVAGNTILGHMLERLAAVTTEEVVFVTGRDQAAIATWVRREYPQLDSHFVAREAGQGPAQAILLCREYLQQEPAGVLLVFGDGLVDGDYAGLAEQAREQKGDAVLYVYQSQLPPECDCVAVDEAGLVTRFLQKEEAGSTPTLVAGLVYWPDGERLLAAAGRVDGASRVPGMMSGVLAQGGRILTRPVRQFSGTGSPESLLMTNARLLAIGYHSAEAIERSYAEEFLVLPPVYLHPEAQVQNAVIGPYATIGAGAVVKEALVRHCILEAGAQVRQCLLENALVGERAQVTGRAAALHIGDDAVVTLN